ncbi:MAG TPA: DEAD/DEAH box helicase [Gammaproteobacteria bacterium]
MASQALPPWDSSLLDIPRLEGKTRFYDLPLPDVLLRGIHDLGFQYCSPIQAQILPETLQGKDAIGKAQTGTGKTAAFLITVMVDLLKHPHAADRGKGKPRALIIAPTRELVAQITEDARALGKHTGLHVVPLIGGADFDKQRRQLDTKPADIVVATPGRLLDFMKRKYIHLNHVKALVLDEADRMLDMGFIPQVQRIIRAMPGCEHRQTLLFSATFTAEIIKLSSQWTRQPVRIEIEPENLASDTILQKVYLVSSAEKLKALLGILRQPDIGRAIVFTNRRDQAQRLFDRLIKAGISAGLLTGDIPQHKRTSTLKTFKAGTVRVLVATDVAGRGIHVEGISHVINYNLPENPGDYVHRIGRTGRAGVSGISISLACEDESFQIPAIEELLGYKLACEFSPQ